MRTSMTFTMPSTFVVVSNRSPSGSYAVWNGCCPSFVSPTILRSRQSMNIRPGMVWSEITMIDLSAMKYTPSWFTFIVWNG